MLEPTVSGSSLLVSPPDESSFSVQIDQIDLSLSVEVRGLPRFERPLEVSVRQAALLNHPPWVRSLGKIGMEVTTQGWRFPTPPDQVAIRNPLSGSRQLPAIYPQPMDEDRPSGRWSEVRTSPCIQPDRGCITVSRDAMFHQRPWQVKGVVRPQKACLG